MFARQLARVAVQSPHARSEPIPTPRLVEVRIPKNQLSRTNHVKGTHSGSGRKQLLRSGRKEDGHSEEGLKNLAWRGTAGKGWALAVNFVVFTGYCGPAHVTVNRTVKIRKTELKVEADQSAQMTIWSRATVPINETAHLARSQAFSSGLSSCPPRHLAVLTALLHDRDLGSHKACVLHHASTQLFSLLLE